LVCIYFVIVNLRISHFRLYLKYKSGIHLFHQRFRSYYLIHYCLIKCLTSKFINIICQNLIILDKWLRVLWWIIVTWCNHPFIETVCLIKSVILIGKYLSAYLRACFVWEARKCNFLNIFKITVAIMINVVCKISIDKIWRPLKSFKLWDCHKCFNKRGSPVTS